MHVLCWNENTVEAWQCHHARPPRPGDHTARAAPGRHLDADAQQVRLHGPRAEYPRRPSHT